MKSTIYAIVPLFASILALQLASLRTHAEEAPVSPVSDSWPSTLPVYDHIVIVFEENKNFEQIIGNAWTPYVSSVLAQEGAIFTKIYGEEHYSEGNYFWLFSGGNHGMGFVDTMPKHPLDSTNLGEQLIKKGLSFKGYSEDLPETGSQVVVYPPKPARALYARKHVPWVSFPNVPPACSVPFTEFPRDAAGFSQLPTVAIVIPNLLDDMHDGKPVDSVPRGDRWLKDNLDAYYQWAKSHNSLLIVTFDENDNKAGYSGITNPAVVPGTGVDQEFRRDLQNRIPTIVAGAQIKPGKYPEGRGITHVNLLRTMEAMYGLARSGAQQPNALGFGMADDYVVRDIFEKALRD
jgi:acid phosphatase